MKKRIAICTLAIFVVLVVFLIVSQFIVIREMPSCCICDDIRAVTLWQQIVGDYPHYTCEMPSP